MQGIYSTVQGFFHQPAYPRGEGATIKRIGPPRKPPAGGGLRRIRGVSAVGFTGKNRPSELTCIYFSWSPPRIRGGIRKVGGAYESGIFPFTCTYMYTRIRVKRYMVIKRA